MAAKKLLKLSFDEFEKIVSMCKLTFNTWDEEYDKLLILLKEICKKNLRKDDIVKTFLMISPNHKQLQTRLENVKK